MVTALLCSEHENKRDKMETTNERVAERAKNSSHHREIGMTLVSMSVTSNQSAIAAFLDFTKGWFVKLHVERTLPKKWSEPKYVNLNRISFLAEFTNRLHKTLVEHDGLVQRRETNLIWHLKNIFGQKHNKKINFILNYCKIIFSINLCHIKINDMKEICSVQQWTGVSCLKKEKGKSETLLPRSSSNSL